MNKPNNHWARINRPDWFAIFLMASLIIIGIIMMFSTSPVIGKANFNNSYFFIKRHLIFFCLGSIACFLGSQIPHKIYKKYLGLGFIGSNILLAMTLIPGLGVKISGASRWLNLGIIKFQPVEVVKFFIIVYLAVFLMNKKEKIKHFKEGFLPIIGVIVIPIFLLSNQPDLGNTMLILCLTVGMLFFGGIPLLQISVTGISVALFMFFSVLINPYQMDRIRTFLYPWNDPQGTGYHIIQSFIAIGSGGFWGLGLGESKLKYFYLPLHYSDFIFSIICEEGGFVLGTIVLVLFLLLLRRGLFIAKNVSDPFSSYLAQGITLILIGQALMNIGSVIGVLPVSGIPLTFISFGGTSLVTSMFLMGVLINISKYMLVERA